jgi:hypothetical protein
MGNKGHIKIEPNKSTIWNRSTTGKIREAVKPLQDQIDTLTAIVEQLQRKVFELPPNINVQPPHRERCNCEEV